MKYEKLNYIIKNKKGLLKNFKLLNNNLLKNYNTFRKWFFYKYNKRILKRIANIFLTFTKNNFYLTATNHLTKKAFVVLSSGQTKYKTSKLKLSYSAMESLALLFVKKIKIKKIKYLNLIFLNKTGLKKGKLSGPLFKKIKEFNFIILSSTYKFKWAHNGIRLKKSRRL